MHRYRNCDISELVNETLVEIKESNWDGGLTFKTESGREFRMFHSQSCCENVNLEEVVGGELDDLIGHKILHAECTSDDSNENNDYYGYREWTFYHIRTMYDSLTLRWLGESNGYYSVEVDFQEILSKS